MKPAWPLIARVFDSSSQLGPQLIGIGLLALWAFVAPAKGDPVQVDVVFTFPFSGIPEGYHPQSNVLEIPGSPGIFLTTAKQDGFSGTCGNYGLTGCGTLVKIDTTTGAPPFPATVVHAFDGSGGAAPRGNLVAPGDGWIYGVTQFGGNQPANAVCQFGCGVVYRFNPADPSPATNFKVVYTFGRDAADSDGQQPLGITVGKDANGFTVLYGTTYEGGPPPPLCGGTVALGTVFRLDPPYDSPSTFVPLNCFQHGMNAGGFPSPPMQASDTMIYGSTGFGIWSVDPKTAAENSPIFIVPGGSGSLGSEGRLVEVGGSLYGTVESLPGSLFQYNLGTQVLSNLHTFTGGAEGTLLHAGLLLSSDGNLYGTTARGGGPADSGTLFQLVPGKTTPTTMHVFASNVDGAQPWGELSEASDGFLYGTTFLFGPGGNGGGTVFRATHSGVPNWKHQDAQLQTWSIGGSDLSGRVYVFGKTLSYLGGAGSGAFFVTRYNANGDIDTTFGGINGFVQFGPDYGTSIGDLARIVVDPDGTSYVAGNSNQSFGGFTNKGGTDVFAAKLDPSGNLLWVYMFGSPQDDTVRDLAVDTNHNLYLTGYTVGNLGGPLQGVQDGFVSLLTPARALTTFQWGVPGQRRYGTGVAYCVDPQNVARVYVSGGDFAANNNSGNGWISWFKAANITAGLKGTQTLVAGGSDENFSLGSLTTDTQCDPYVVGGHSILHSGLSYFFVQKYDPTLSSAGTTLVLGPEKGIFGTVGAGYIHLDTDKNIYLAGTAIGPQQLWGLPVTGQIGAFFVVYDPTGGKRLRVGTINPDPGDRTTTLAAGLALDLSGNITIGGYSDGAIADGQAAGGYLQQFSPVNSNSSRPAVSLSPTALSFGKVVIGQISAPQTVTLTNTGTAALHISSMSMTGDYAIASNGCGLTIMAGANCVVGVTFTPTKKGNQAGTLTFTDDAPGTPQTVSLTGIAQSILLSPTSLNFGTIAIGSASSQQDINVTNNGPATVKFTGFALAGTAASDFLIAANTCGQTIASDGSCKVSIQFKPTKRGTRNAKLNVKNNGGGSPASAMLKGIGN